MKSYDWVELEDGRPIRIVRNYKEVGSTVGVMYQFMPREDAVGAIRHELFLRQKGECRMCGKVVTEARAHMHEQTPRGKGGEISLENSEILCADCHLNIEHGDRKPQFTRRKR